MRLPIGVGLALATALLLHGAEVRSLDGQWKIATDPENSGKSQKWFAAPPVAAARDCLVPDILQRTFPAYNGVVWYWREFDAPKPAQGERLRLRFYAADYLAEVWVNSEFAGSHEGGETPFSFDITRVARAGSNRVVVRLLNPGPTRIDGIVLNETPHGIKNVPMTVGNFWNPGGLWQGVELLRLPAVRIGDVVVEARRETRTISTRVHAVNESSAAVRGTLALEVEAGGTVLRRDTRAVTVPPGASDFDLSAALETVHEWTVDDPYLYRVSARLQTPASADSTSVRTGFRDFLFRDGYFRLNGRRIFLKGTHSVGHFPIGQHVPEDPELLRRELIAVKSMGFNTVRWLGRTMFPSQLELCDELGLLVYEESYASWRWEDSPDMQRRFDSAVREMILRDRNHPSVVIWGLLNETVANPVFRHAVEMLPLIRSVDPTRLVLLSSGRWDGQWSIGSLANPGSSEWNHALGAEAPGAPAVEQKHPGGYTSGAGDAHMYVPRPWREEDLRFFRTTGAGMKHVFLSEYGNGSQIDPVRIIRLMEQAGAGPELEDYRLYRQMYDQLERDWKQWGLDQVFAAPSDMVTAGQAMQSEQRRLSLNAIRSNPNLVGYSLTGLSDQAVEGEGLMTTFRELKPGIVDAMRDGFAPLKWCLFVERGHIYRGAGVRVEAVLANEDVLKPGSYPFRLTVVGPAGVVYEKSAAVQIGAAEGSGEPMLAIPAFDARLKLDGPAGRYTVEVAFTRGAAASARETVITEDVSSLPKVNASVAWSGENEGIGRVLTNHGVRLSRLGQGSTAGPQVILRWRDSDRSWVGDVKAGSVAILLEPSKLPEPLAGAIENSAPLFWGRDDVVRPHEIFAGLPSARLMDLHYYGDLIARTSVTGFGTDAENVVPSFALGKPGGQGYWAGSNLLVYRLGAGRVIVSTLRIAEHVERNPAADRLLLNLVDFASRNLGRSGDGARRTGHVPMRDGVRLATDVYSPPGAAKAPVLLMRTPYNKAAVETTARKYAAAGYYVVVQDTRGRYESGGAFYPYNNEGQDGYDTLDWIRRQPWSDGRVGMWGASYVGAVQWQAAAEGAPGLAVLAPTATWSSFYRNIYLGGTARLALIAQAAASLEPPPAGVAQGLIDWSSVLLHLPLSDLDRAIGWNMPWLNGILTHNRPDGFWHRLDVTDAVAAVHIPVQHVVGYYDFFCREVVANFQRLRGRAEQQLILGPWEHGTIGKSKVADVDFGPDAAMDLAQVNLSWFDRVLKGTDRHFSPVRYFSMGDNRWHDSGAWPPGDSVPAWFYLHSGGRANSRRGDGRLDRDEPRSEAADVFLADPTNPVPAVPSGNGRKRFEAVWGPVDQSPSEDRDDVLVYSTATLSRPLRFAGPLTAELSVAADTPDSDWVVKLVDVRPDGFAQNLAVGIQRSSFLASPPPTDGRSYKITVDLGHAAATIAPGHMLRVEVTGSYFPQYDRNTNTGEGPGGSRILVAHQRLEHSRGAASRVLLPVLQEGK